MKQNVCLALPSFLFHKLQRCNLKIMQTDRHASSLLLQGGNLPLHHVAQNRLFKIKPEIQNGIGSAVKRLVQANYQIVAVVRLFHRVDHYVLAAAGNQAEAFRQFTLLCRKLPAFQRLVQGVRFPHRAGLAVIAAVGQQRIGKGMAPLIGMGIRIGSAFKQSQL